MTATVSRRDFLRAGAAGTTLLLGVVVPLRRPGLGRLAPPAPGGPVAPLAPSAFLEVDATGAVTVWVTKSEMGQGVQTALPMLVAEELEADWNSVRVRQADADPRFGDQDTGGSQSVSSLWDPLRTAGAQAREMLVAAAAARWTVPASECRAERGAVIHPPTGRRLAYGDLVAEAAALPVPEHPRLKSASEYRLIGRDVPRLDLPNKVNGSAGYGIDVRVPGMLYASIARCPVFGGRMSGYDAAAARAVPGVREVVEIPSGVAVVADSTWAAFQGKRALACRWDEGAAGKLDSPRIAGLLRARAALPGDLARNDGDASRALARAARRIEAEYEVPFLAHAPMEPMNCTAHHTGDRCEVWAPTQVPSWTTTEVSKALGLAPEQMTVHVTLLGGGFGRRLLFDFVIEAAQVSKQIGAPVQVVWTREDDLQHGWYRPTSLHRLAAALDAKGRPTAWFHRIVAPSINAQRWPERFQARLDQDAVDGAADLPYAFPNLRVEFGPLSTPVPVSWWRSVYASQNAFANECFVDEVAHAARQDPVAFRRALLQGAPRHRRALELAAEKAGWGVPLPRGRARGVAVHQLFGQTIVAQVAEVSIEGGRPRVHRVVCAIDCGTVVHPDGVRAQMESGVVYGLSAALHGAITIKGGAVEQTNFDSYPVLRMNEMPAVEVHLVPSTEAPSGAGEPAVPPIAPAVANAVFALTGRPVRRLPISV
jgi:isoquinoline 1-oxidoreductase beta subunit